MMRVSRDAERSGAERARSVPLCSASRLTVYAVVCITVVNFSLADPPPPGSVRDLVYFGPGGPVRLRFHVTVGGRPVDAVWADAVDALFKLCDRSGDGVLDAQERAVFAPPRRRRNAADGFDPTAAPPVELKFGRDDENVTRAAFADAVRAAGFGPARLAFTPARSDSAQLSAALFRRLDRDGDGRLSADELRAARDRLAALDANEDEYISAAELLGRAEPAAVSRGNNVFAPPAVDEDASASSPDMQLLAPAGPEAAKQILAARGSGRSASLSREEFGADPATFAALDKDRNGRLDAGELTGWLRQPADANVELEFDTQGRLAKRARLGDPKAGPDEPVQLAGVVLRFQPAEPNGPSARAAWDEASGGLLAEFRRHATDSQPVARDAMKGTPALARLFDLADRTGTGKLAVPDLESALKALAPLACCRLDVAVTDQGGGLFELLDRNGDGRLSPRELIEAAAAVRPFAGPDGCVGPNQLPKRFQVRVVPATLPLVVVPAPGARSVTPPAGPQTDVPAWFLKMDRNGDGEVSLREFLGPIERFRKLDRDGDGLISAAEARTTGR